MYRDKALFFIISSHKDHAHVWFFFCLRTAGSSEFHHGMIIVVCLSQQPFMEVKISESPKRSRRDSGLDCDENSPESRCCRYPLTVDFENFGWDWIIAPKRYKANYCSGECEYMHLQKYPHTHLVNKANPRGSAGPCCTPTKMSPINMLYFNRKEQIIYGKIPSMVVDRCGCSWVSSPTATLLLLLDLWKSSL